MCVKDVERFADCERFEATENVGCDWHALVAFELS
jgi:hypothetical protein